MSKDKPHQVSNKRPDGFYAVDNEMVEVFAPLVGIYAFGVYHLLRQRAYRSEDDRAISIQGIAQAMAISKDAATAAIDTLRKVGLLEMHSSTRPNTSPKYVVVHPKDALAANPEIARSHPEIRIKTNAKRILKSGRSASCNQDEGRRKSGHSHPEIRMPNIEEEFKEERKEQDTNPLPPFQGGEGLDSDFSGQPPKTPTTRLASSEHSRTDGERTPDRSGGSGPANAEAVAKNDGQTQQEAELAAVDLKNQGEFDETEDETPMAHGLVRSVHETLPDGGRERLLAADPSDPAPAAVGAPAARHSPQLSRDRKTVVEATLASLVGLKAPVVEEEEATPRQLAQMFLQELHQQFATAYGMSSNLPKGPNWEDPYEAWMRCFDHVRIGDIEADGEAWMVVLETRRPKDLASGLEKYRPKVQIALRKAFGREVQLVPRMEG